MKTVKKGIAILLVFILSIIILGGSVSAASVSIRASASKVTARKKCFCDSFFWREGKKCTV